MRKFNYTTYSVPLLCTTDCSWPIIKCLIGTFNNETLEQYIMRSYQIVSGKATDDTLSINFHKTFVHISLCHSMKAYCKKIDNSIKKMSGIANTGNLNEILLRIKHLFNILLSPSSSQCKDAVSYFEIH